MLTRCFIAINIPRNIREELIPLLKELKEKGVRTVSPKNLHFTLKFLGEIKPDKIQKTIEALSKLEFNPFKIEVKGAGAFPNQNYIKVVWVGAKNEEFEKFAKEINESLNGLFPKENFSAHLTLGRLNKKANLSSFFEKYKEKSFGSFVANSFELIQSDLTKEGPAYSVLWSSSEE